MHWIALMGFITGLRTMTAIAAICWFAHFGLIPVDHTWAFWAASWISVIVFTLAAIGEYIGDVQPQTPSRKSLFPALARLAFGGLVGAICVTAEGEPIVGGIILGMIGALLGTHLGYWARMRASRAVGRDLPVGLTESAFALALAILNSYFVHKSVVRMALIEAGKLHYGG